LAACARKRNRQPGAGIDDLMNLSGFGEFEPFNQGRASVADENEEEEGVTLEEILIEILDAQIELVEAVASGKPLTDGEGLKLRLNDLREILENSVVAEDDD